MTIHELLSSALVLAHAGFLEVSEVEELKGKAESAEKHLALKGGFLEHYEHEARIALQNLDGTELALQFWREAQRLAVMVRRETRLLNEALWFIREEVERQVAHGTHRKAAVARKEVRA